MSFQYKTVKFDTNKKCYEDIPIVKFIFKDKRDDSCGRIIEIGAWRLHAKDVVKLFQFLSEFCVPQDKSEINSSDEYGDEES